MKVEYSNFTPLGEGYLKYFERHMEYALVTETRTSGFWWFKKVKTRKRDVFKDGYWCFLDTGALCPDEISKLERLYYAREIMYRGQPAAV